MGRVFRCVIPAIPVTEVKVQHSLVVPAIQLTDCKVQHRSPLVIRSSEGAQWRDLQCPRPLENAEMLIP